MDIETLYPLVTEAIRRAEVFDELNAPGTCNAYLDVSLLEERIASVVPASDAEGAIARRGAVSAAIAGHEFQRAHELVERFSTESGTDSALRTDLAELRVRASAMADRASHLRQTQFAHAYARYGIEEIRRFAYEFHRQGAPLPIW